MGGELVRITSSAVSGFVAKLISTNIWIALNDVAEPGSREFQFDSFSLRVSVSCPNYYSILWKRTLFTASYPGLRAMVAILHEHCRFSPRVLSPLTGP